MAHGLRSHRMLAGGALLLALAAPGCATNRQAEQQARQAQSHYDLGVDHMTHGRAELALRELLLADRLRPDDPPTHYALAQAYIYKRKFDDAEKNLLRALELSPGYQVARIDLSSLYLQQRRWQEALAQTRILLNDPTYPAPWRALSNQGWAELNLGLTAEARRDLQAAREHSPGYWPAILNLGILEQQAGHRLEAAELFEHMLEMDLDPNAEAEASYRLAEIYISLGKRERALPHLMTAVARTPDGEWGKKSEEYLKRLR
jgi:Tfp pilus assembly protein PilF